MNQPVIYKYLDYRVFLKDMFDYRKNNNKNFSHRYLAKKAGFSSPNFIKLVSDGSRNLTSDSIIKVSGAFGLKRQENEFFENLVLMNQADTHEKKNHYYKKLMSANSYINLNKLEKESYEYFSKWYYPVIREIICFNKGCLQNEDIARILAPPISVAQVKKALNLLTKLELIKKDNDGRWIQCDKIVSTGPEVTSLIVANYHKELLRLAHESIDRFQSNERDITALTLNIKEEQITLIKEKITLFRKDLLEMACSEEQTDRVVQLNFQLFPLTNKLIKENNK